jgi:hypothetical protein
MLTAGFRCAPEVLLMNKIWLPSHPDQIRGRPGVLPLRLGVLSLRLAGVEITGGG